MSVKAILFLQVNHGRKDAFLVNPAFRASQFRRVVLQTLLDVARAGVYLSQLPGYSDKSPLLTFLAP